MKRKQTRFIVRDDNETEFLSEGFLASPSWKLACKVADDCCLDEYEIEGEDQQSIRFAIWRGICKAYRNGRRDAIEKGASS